MIQCHNCNGNGYTNYEVIKKVNKYYSFFSKIINYFNNVKMNIKISKIKCETCNGTGKIKILKRNLKIETLILGSVSPNFLNNTPKLKINSLILKSISPKNKKNKKIKKIKKNKKKFKPNYAGW